MIRNLINLRALNILARLDIDISVRSALRLVIFGATITTGAVISLTYNIHIFYGTSPLTVGNTTINRIVVISALLWIVAGVGSYIKTQSWLNESTESPLTSEEFSLKVLLGADVLSTALVERFLTRLFTTFLLFIFSIGVLIHASLNEILILILSAEISIIFHCLAACKTLLYYASPVQKLAWYSPLLRIVIALSLVPIILLGFLEWQNIGEHTQISERILYSTTFFSSFISIIVMIRFTYLVKEMKNRPLGIPINRLTTPIYNRKLSQLLMYISLLLRLFVCRPLLSGLIMTRWTLAMTIIIAIINLNQIASQIIWIAAFILLSTLQSIFIIPDILMEGPIVRYYYEEKGKLFFIFLTAIITRILALLPQICTLYLLGHFVGGLGLNLIILSVLVIISDIFSNGIAGSSHHRTSQYSIAMSGLISFISTLLGTVVMTLMPFATVCLTSILLIAAFFFWRSNIAYIS